MTQVLADIQDYASKIGRRSALSVGNFDGVHRGHCELIGVLIQEAHREGLVSVILTFEPHPMHVLGNSGQQKRLTSPTEKVKLLRNTGVEAIILQRFNLDFAAMGPEDFVTKIVCEALSTSVMVIGPGFRFGAGRSGDMALLENVGKENGIRVVQVPSVIRRGRMVSSSSIRNLLSEEGDVSLAADMLGRFYKLEGTVVKGAGRGTRLGFPTANLADVDVLVPKEGVYAGAGLVSGRFFPAAIHIGERKTFGEPPSIEVHLVGWRETEPLVGRRLTVFLMRRLRDVIQFEDEESLKERVGKDVAEARAAFEESEWNQNLSPSISWVGGAG